MKAFKPLLLGFVLGCLRMYSADVGLPAGVQNTQPDASQPLDPKESLARITVPKGFRASLYAKEPELHQPIAFDFDDRGRIWAVECYSYPEFQFKNADRIVIFSDEDNDGQQDHRTVFWDQGDRLTGIQLGYGGVWLTAPPYLLFLPDRNQDDQPDGPPEIVLDGFTLDANHNFVNGLTWAPDGWLWGRHGILAESRPGLPESPLEDRPRLKCGLWRYHPTLKRFEILARGTTNPWGLDFDNHGHAFFSNNVIGHLWHLIPGARYQRMFGKDDNPHSYDLLKAASDHLHWTGARWQNARGGEAHDELGGGHSHSGGMIYLGNNWPNQYRGQFFMNNIHGNRMLFDRLERYRSGFVAKCGDAFLRANDPWFRGVTIKYGPDGGVFVSDWNDLGECHDNDGSYRSSGRLYKIIYGEQPLLPSFDLSKQTDLELARNVLHENEWFVRHSRRLLQERTIDRPLDDDVTAFLYDIAQNHPSIPRQLRAIWTLWACQAIKQDQLLAFSRHQNEHIRYWAIRLATDLAPPGDLIVQRFETLAATDPSALVRLALAAALQRLDQEDVVRVARGLVTREVDADDPNIPLMIWYGIEPMIESQTSDALALIQTTKIPLLRQYIARRLSSGAQETVERIKTRGR